MECTKEYLYFFIESLRRCGKNADEISAMINESWPDQTISVRRIREVCQEFREGSRTSFGRRSGSGRSISDSRKENVEAVEQMINNDPHLTLREIARNLEISHTIVQRILVEDLDKLWIHTKWIPHTLSEHNKSVRVARCQDLLESLSSRLTKSNLVTVDEKFFYCRKLQPRNKIGIWIDPFGDDDIRQTARRSSMEDKFLVIIAVSQRGQHYFEILQRNEHINADRYIKFLSNLVNYFRAESNPILPENMRLQHDNARPHTARATAEHIEDMNIRLLRQPPYSPDLNLCDRYIFPRLEALRSNFNSAEDIREFLTRELPMFTVERMSRALTTLMEHMRKVIENGGNYI